jgi:hypothetical protein
MRLCPPASAIHLQRGNERFLQDVDLAELPHLIAFVPAEHMRCDDGVVPLIFADILMSALLPKRRGCCAAAT